MAVTSADLITLAPELSTVDVAILNQALSAVPLVVDLTTFPERTDLLTKYVALHILTLMGFGKQANGRVVSKSAGGVSITYATAATTSFADLSSTTWGSLYRMAVRAHGLRGAVT